MTAEIGRGSIEPDITFIKNTKRFTKVKFTRNFCGGHGVTALPWLRCRITLRAAIELTPGTTMQENQHASSPVNRIVIVLGILSMIGMLAFGVLFLRSYYAPVRWNYEYLRFASGPHCFVFLEPKLAIFLGDGGTEEIFDCINGCGSNIFDANGFRGSRGMTGSNSVEVFSYEGQGGKTIMRFGNGKCTMVVSRHGTRLTLADGRKFRLDGRTPLWLRCKSDGTIVQLDKLPEGFDEFFESPPSDPGLIDSIKSWPEAFQ